MREKILNFIQHWWQRLSENSDTTAIERPHWYKVVMHVTEDTPLGFVGGILNKFFGMTIDQSLVTLANIGEDRMIYIGEYTYEVAEHKVTDVNRNSYSMKFNLKAAIQRVVK